MKKCYLVIASLVLTTTLLGACGNKGNTAGKEETIAVEKTGMPIVKEKNQHDDDGSWWRSRMG